MAKGIAYGIACLLLATWILPAWAAPSTTAASATAAVVPPGSKKEKPPTKPTAGWSFSSTNTLRHEYWNTFQAVNSPLDPSYSLLADRLALTLKHQNPATVFTATLNVVKFLNLPEDTSFGSASTYSTNGVRENDAKVYVRVMNFTFKRLGDKRLTATIGRFNFANGTEWKGSDPTVEWVKNNRIADRLLGQPNWTMLQRSMNGLVLKHDLPRFQLAASAWKPTAGTYSEQAGDLINDIKVFTLAGTHKFDTALPRQEVQWFAYEYDDHRPIVAPRGDNAVTGAAQTPRRSTDGIDVRIRTYGVSAVGAYDCPTGRVDTMVWWAVQRGDWYELTHRAHAVALELGHQWTKAPWKPWLRAGLNQSSGDADPHDGTHGTFFLMLPSRKYSNCNAYNQSNLKDYLLQLSVKPSARADLRFDYHRLRLTEGADRWYTGGGAMANTGPGNGFTARKTGGKTDLGSVFEFLGTYTLSKEHKVNLFVSRLRGGDAIDASFGAKRDQTFSYLELVTDF
ncbi:MAG: hypothetical protein OZSIB_2124 [Candidatus Ozemobacter sibiricus]|jgi:hypothetical protein|uniref:Alginate export domain-containing protein n=1 Tax=Candidatus Ozemobacter sibiricus TaxID=2268124 RepID=A0A367ZSY4_9BACT|nr:MAG: hypothetical protein OZSIB_2124 [Candidatus Ozemobacter sibiricus]